MIKNEKGSVLSIAIVIIFVLSFAITTTSAYTADVAERTSTIVTNNDEDLFARTMVRGAMHDLKEFIYTYPLAEYTQFFFEDQAELDRLEAYYNPIIAEYYLAAYDITLTTDALSITIVDFQEFDESSTSFTRTYLVSFIKQNGNEIKKDLYVELKDNPDDDTTEDPILDVGGLFDFIGTDTFDDFVPYVCTDCSADIVSDFYLNDNNNPDIPNNPNRGKLSPSEQRILIDDSVAIDPTPGASSSNASTYFDLNGSALLVNQDLTIDNNALIYSSMEGVPGIIIVLGDLYLENTKHNLEINDVYMFVMGNVYITVDGNNNNQRILNGDNFYIISPNPINVTAGPNSDYFTDTTTVDLNTYYYLGSFAEFPTFQSIEDNLQRLVDFDGDDSFNAIFNYIEGVFEEE